MLKYADLINVPVRAITENLVVVQPRPNLRTRQIDKNMFGYTGVSIYVRTQVLKKLYQASKLLTELDSSLALEIVYGYRALSIQNKLFLKYKKKFSDKYVDTELIEAAHRLIAVPEVAGHPTGGAVDIQILKSGKPLNMGTKIWQFNKDAFTFSPFVSKQGQANRQLLRRTMMKVGFAPFDGEWWHFSYGDKEWAKYYKKPFALYEQIEFKKEV